MIPVSQPYMFGNERKYVLNCIDTNWISSGGKYIKEFENKFESLIDAKYALTTSNGTASLHLALAAIGIKEGDEVIIPNLTFVSTANVIRYCNATPVLIDVKKNTACIDPTLIEKKISDRTKAIIPVHLYGNVADMQSIMNIAKRNNLFVIEDAAEAHGAMYKNEYVGTIGDVGCFSFFGNKIITTGEGGMCVTKNRELYDKMFLLKNHGMSPTERFYHSVIGFNYRMTNIQAAVGLAQVENFEKIISIRDQQYLKYFKRLSGVEGISFLESEPSTRSVNWMFSILIEDEFPLSRDETITYLEKMSIETRPFFKLMSKMPPYLDDLLYENSEELSNKGLNLPSSASLSDGDIEKICDIISGIQK